MNRWIIFFQNPHDRIVFLTEEMQEKSAMPYKKFIDFLYSNYITVNRSELQKSIDSFKTILLNADTGEWSIQEKPSVEGSFEEMIKLNPDSATVSDSLKDKEKEVDPLGRLIERKNKIIDSIFSKRRETNDPFSRYR